jgi:hypothetical protein
MIYITFKGVEYVIPYDRETLKINRVIDSTFDNGYFETQPLEVSTGLDFSRRIPRNLWVRIERDGRTFQFKTGETYIQQLTFGDTKKYKHMINLISPAKDLTLKPLENMTVTQPKGDFGLYSRSINILDDADKTFDNDTGVRVWDENLISYSSVPFENAVNTDITKIDGVTITDLDDYQIAVEVVGWNKDIIFASNTVFVRVKYDGSIITSYSFEIPRGRLLRPTKSSNVRNISYTPTVLGDFSVEIQTASQVVIQDVNVSIVCKTVQDKPIRTYAQVVDKMLLRSEYVLSPLSRPRLNLTAPEDKYEEYTLYDALSKMGGYLGALVRVGDLINERYGEQEALHRKTSRVIV